MKGGPLARTGVDWPGGSAAHNGLFASVLSGKFFPRDVPFWFGRRQLSKPWPGAACVGGTAANWPAAATLRAPTTNEREKFMCSGRKVQCLRRNNKTKFSFLERRDYSTPRGRLQP